MHSETKTKFLKSQINPNAIFRDDEHQAEIGILGIRVNAGADVEDEATKKIWGRQDGQKATCEEKTRTRNHDKVNLNMLSDQ